MNITEVDKCRICASENLAEIIDLGNLHLTGIFPKENEIDKVPVAPLVLVKCDKCGLVQIKHTYSLDEMYGENYGYRSGLNKSMVKHLNGIVSNIVEKYDIDKDDLIVDIGSNDSTLLRSYPQGEYALVGIDPSGSKFKKFYPETVKLIPDFFSSKLIKEVYGSKKAKVITSISMFYDLEQPTEFMRQIHEILDDNGIWVMEQSYMPTMIENLAYDTVCHEHLEYYCLKQIKWMADEVGLQIIDVTLNDTNGGSFCVTLAKKGSKYQENVELVNKYLAAEKKYDEMLPFEDFADDIRNHKVKLLECLNKLKESGKVVAGYGASTKGNVVLQYCDINESLMPYIVEVNEDKFGSFTPGSNILIVSEEKMRSESPDYVLVLPWHFRDFIVNKEEEYLQSGGKIIFPLPSMEIVSAENKE